MEPDGFALEGETPPAPRRQPTARGASRSVPAREWKFAAQPPE